MFRTHNCGQLNINNVGETVTLSGWTQITRKFGSITFVDLRDRYGITQLFFNEAMTEVLNQNPLGREFVVQATGKVIERSNKNPKMPTGDIEIEITEYNILNKSATPPFTIEDETDGGEELRMKYRYLDLRRNPLRRNLELRYQVGRVARNYLHEQGFLDIETPFLIRSTPEGARDFVVPSRMNEGQFYALPQSPQTFKQLLMVSGYDRYYQIVKCFRDEDLRADRQPEFTQIDCEMSFVDQEDILNNFEGMFKHIFKEIKGIDMPEAFPRMTYKDAMWHYGNDKPDIRFEMKINNLKVNNEVYCEALNGVDFKVTDEAASILAIAVPNGAEYTRKQTDEITEWVKRPQIGMTGMLFIKCNADGTFKSSVDKFFDENRQKQIAAQCGAKAGDIVLILAGGEDKTRSAMANLRLEMAERLGWRDKFGLKIVNRTQQVKSVKQVYSLRIPMSDSSINKNKNQEKKYNRYKGITIDGIVKAINSATTNNSSGAAIELIELNNGSIVTVFGNKISTNRDSIEEIVLKRATKSDSRNNRHFFIFVEGANNAFSILDKIRNEISLLYNYKLLWVVDFPLFEHNEEDGRYYAKHHPFTAPKPEQAHLMDEPARFGEINANAYDIVLNGTEIGGGSIRIYQKEMQQKMFAALGMSEEEAKEQFGFLLGAFEYGAPPHGGLAFGFDRLCALLGGDESIRDYIAFPKNNSGRDVMLDAPSALDNKQLDELSLKVNL